MQLYIMHSYDYLSLHSEINMHLNKHSFTCSSFLINSKYRIAEVKYTRSLILWEPCSATSYIAATFHQTIGQRAHQYLSNAATPELGMILQGIRELAGLHIARIHKTHSQDNQVGLSGH